jgi:hypothetical protein
MLGRLPKRLARLYHVWRQRTNWLNAVCTGAALQERQIADELCMRHFAGQQFISRLDPAEPDVWYCLRSDRLCICITANLSIRRSLLAFMASSDPPPRVEAANIRDWSNEAITALLGTKHYAVRVCADHLPRLEFYVLFFVCCAQHVLPHTRGLHQAVERAAQAPDLAGATLVSHRYLHDDKLFKRVPLQEGFRDVVVASTAR